MAKSPTGSEPPPQRAQKAARRNDGAHARVESVHIRNFRSLLDVEVRLGNITVLIGANGTGKTTILDALGLFASKKPSVTKADYNSEDCPIDITLTIRPGAHSVEGRLLHGGLMTLRRSFSLDGSADKGGMRARVRRNRHFDGVRGAATTDRRKKAAELRSTMYPDLPEYKNKDDFAERLDAYERRLSQDPRYNKCHYMKFTEWSGWQDQVARMLEVTHVPAMKDIAADGEDGSRSLLSVLMGIAIRDAKRGDAALAGIMDAVNAEYAKYKRAFRVTIRELGAELGKKSKAYMRNGRFRIKLRETAVSPSHPDASVLIGDGGPMVPVGHAGSGFQRVYLLSLLETIAHMRKKMAPGEESAPVPASPLRLVVIDEPELYQHPQRQRQILKNFIGVTEGDSPISIVCSTHSPYFVELQKVDKLRLLQKGEKPASITTEELEGLDDRLKGGSAWLDMNATHWITEGFFARLAVVVEGSSDRNALLAAARAMRRADRNRGAAGQEGTGGPTAGKMHSVDLDEHEITIVPAGGVENVDIIARLYERFGIPVYMVWDLDCCGGRCDDGVRERNRNLAAIATCGEGTRAPKKTAVKRTHACFEGNLTETLAEELLDRGELLEGMKEYKSLQKAAEADRKTMEGSGSKRCAFCECWDRAKGKDGAQKRVITAQKRVLKSKLDVFMMLDRIRRADPQSLEKMTVAKIVRRIEMIGKSSRHSSRP
ncbi:MAG: AAA family ATPase [Thaumarchaeota archaeon]|nr:AAA family ATPase [Nitrososphaerota archaeon]